MAASEASVMVPVMVPVRACCAKAAHGTAERSKAIPTIRSIDARPPLLGSTILARFTAADRNKLVKSGAGPLLLSAKTERHPRDSRERISGRAVDPRH